MTDTLRFLENLTYDRERPFNEVLAELQKLVRAKEGEAGPDDDDDDALTPVAAALLLRRPLPERAQVLKLLAKSGRLGGTYSDALPVVARTLRPDWLAQALDLAGTRPGEIFGPDKRSLLHLVCESIGTNAWTDALYDEAGEYENVFDTSSSVNWLVSEKGVDERILPTLALLLERGERADAKDKRGKTPLDLARRGRKELRAKDWKRIEAALGERVEASSTDEAKALEDYVHDPAFALGILGALMRDGVVKKAALRRTLGASGGVMEEEDEVAREASALQALHRTQVTQEQLAALETLSFDTDEPIYLWLGDTIGVDLGGESEALIVGSLDGIHHLRGLVALDLRHGYASGAKLAPLLEHIDELPRLQRLGVDPKVVSTALGRTLTKREITISDPPLKEAARKAPPPAKRPRTAEKKEAKATPATKGATSGAAPTKKPSARTTAAKVGARRFELVAGTSKKFWEIELRARKVVTRYGRIGSDGKSTEKSFDSAEDAKREYERSIAEKTRKGYVDA